MPDKHDKNPDRRPDIAKDEKPAPNAKMKEKWHQPEETLSDAPAPSPNPQKRSRTS